MKGVGPLHLLIAALVGLGVSSSPTPLETDFWVLEPRQGANLFNERETLARLQAARDLGLDFVRLAPDRWKGAGRDFLLGSADHYEGIPAADLAELGRVLDAADSAGLKVVLTMLSLPGARWKQNNGGADDGRLWQDESLQADAVRFWGDLATALRDHPAVVGYDVLNEPHPGRTLKGFDDVGTDDYRTWWAATRGTAADLNRFNRRLVAAIRAVDPGVPVILETPGYGDLRATSLLEPIDDPQVLYSFHFYEPWHFTTRRVNKGRFSYPDRMPRDWNGATEAWSRTRIAEMLQPAATWAQAHAVPPRRMLLGEFGCSRRVGGATEYLSDVIDAANRYGWHWAFYSFREDTWSEMDYELGTEALPWKEIEAIQAGTRPREPYRDNALFRMLASKIGD